MVDPRIDYVRIDGTTEVARAYEGQPDRASVRANGLVVDVFAQDDGTVYVEFYAFDRDHKPFVIRFAERDVRHPNVLLQAVRRYEEA